MKRIWAIVVLLPLAAVKLNGQTIQVQIDASKAQPPISKYMYGQFIEHLGGVINSGMWAEMLDDRKFYNPIEPRRATASTQGPRGRGFLRRWTPIGPADALAMDVEHRFVGEHSPRVTLGGQEMRGIEQSGLAVRTGKAYVGRIVLAGDAGAIVSVSLVWGNGPGDRQSIPAGKLTADYSTIPLNFTAAADSDNARLEITGTGGGWFEIGAVSLMPADNIHGFRAEVIGQLRLLHSGVYRFPGGNYISGYDWRDSIGPSDQRPPRWDYAWNTVQSNDVGLDEFMVLFGLLDVDPYMSVNAGFGDARSAEELVQYANGSVQTTMGKLRASNGHTDPYGVKLWGIGNEMYGDWQLGVMPPEQYWIKHNLFARAMREADPSIKLIASGAMPDEMTVTLQGKRLDGKVLTEIGSKADWTGGLLRHCLSNIDLVSEHAYCTSGQGFDMASGQYVNVEESLAEWVRRPANRVRAKFEAYEQYLQEIPALKGKPISLDEYSYRRASPTSFKTAMADAAQFNELFRHTDVFQMAAFTFATSTLSMNRTDAVLNPVGLIFEMYRDHFGTLPVEITGNSPQPKPRYPIGGDQPRVNAGGDAYPLDVVAALTDDRKTLTMAVVNPTKTTQKLDIAVQSVQLADGGELWRMAPGNVNASIVIGQEPQVKIQDIKLDSPPSDLTIAPISVNIYQWSVK